MKSIFLLNELIKEEFLLQNFSYDTSKGLLNYFIMLFDI